MVHGIKFKRKLIVLVFLSMVLSLAKAQTSIALYSFEDHFNSSDFNPAFLTSREGISFSIFPLAGTSLGFNNQQTIRQIVQKSLSGLSSDDDYKEVLKGLTDHFSFNQNFESTLLNITYPSRIGFLNFRVKEIQNFSANLKGELTDFIIRSDIQSAAVNQIQQMPTQAMHYREYSVGYSMPPSRNRLSAGIRAKIYFGKSSFFSGISGSIQNETGNYYLRTEGKVTMSIPEVSMVDSEGTVNNISVFNGSKTINYLMNMGNPGVGFDLGLKYRFSPSLTLSLSALDLGKIFWNTNLNSKYFNGEYAIHSTSVSNEINEEGVEIITKKFENSSFSDSISNIFDLTYDRSSFSNTMPVTFYAGLNYQLNPSLKISLANRYVLVNEMSHNSISVMANYLINKKVSVSTGYSIIGNSKFNIPYAMVIQKNFGQIYFGTDNLLSFIIPSISEFAGFSFGTCFYLFRKKDLFLAPKDDYPFFRPKKIKKQKSKGLILKSLPIG